ncbi:hypothetical protein BC938DRAFT_475991 [Jimgerdemannia flammicorona]|uniref:Uncharacterized protein n=1 Tax=Jimgerdemannia flammicorona TaxID=994334 RepID=A0A433PLE8_9FUNG|nr:hypothetical protein BC938DRAFT_475991 [Jimgerdemannia flammicorona]
MRELEGDDEACQNTDRILETLERIDGPYAIVFWQASAKKLWFGRDCLGRRSLLWHRPRSGDDSFMLTSVGALISAGGNSEVQSPFFEELPANGIYCLDVGLMVREIGVNPDGVHDDDEDIFASAVTHYPWRPPMLSSDPTSLFPSGDNPLKYLTLPFGRINTTTPSPEDLTSAPATDNLDVIPPISSQMQAAIDGLVDVLSDSVLRRVWDIPRIG